MICLHSNKVFRAAHGRIINNASMMQPNFTYRRLIIALARDLKVITNIVDFVLRVFGLGWMDLTSG